MFQRPPLWKAGVLLLVLVACSKGSGPGEGDSLRPPAPSAPPAIEEVASVPVSALPPLRPTRPGLGGPIDGLTPSEAEAFERGRLVFSRRFTPSEGLGPLYNATSCASCHSTPVPGGAADIYRNFYLHGYGSNPLVRFAHPDLPSAVVPAFGTGRHAVASFSLEGGRFNLPDSCCGGAELHLAQRNSIPIFGTGLFEFVSDFTLIISSDASDQNGDGISGRYNRTSRTGPIGRFGVKAQANNVEIFTRAPLQNQMGITSDPFEGADATVSAASAALLQAVVDPNDPTQDSDGVPDPEISRQDLGDLIAFTRFLAPPAPLPFDDAALRGQAQFEALGCVKCHRPSLPSSRGDLAAYTDLLLHDMGPELADQLNFGAPQSNSVDPAHNGNEFRTQPLWGVSLFPPYLHDGRAATLEEAILMHGGEAMQIRDAFEALSPSDRRDLIRFLEHI